MAILERAVGTALVERCPRGIRLTVAGRLLADRARLLLGELACLEHELRRLGERPASVHLGVFSTAGAYPIPLVVQEYRRRTPTHVSSCTPASPTSSRRSSPVVPSPSG
jgi:LysR family nitrogen assimilation transcriptional regulator